jgi:hypothetical protein
VNKFKKIFEDETPFSRSTGDCSLKGKNIVCDRTKGPVVVGVVMTAQLKKALNQESSKGGEIHLSVTDESGRVFSAIIGTKFAY